MNPNEMSSRDLREWHETMPQSATVHYVSEPGQWQGIQVMRARHTLRRFKVASGGHVIMVYRGEPTRCDVHQGRITRSHTQRDGNVYLFPAGETIDATCDGQPNEDIYLKLIPSFVNDVALTMGFGPAQSEIVLGSSEDDAHIRHIAALYDVELTNGGVNGRLFGETLAHVLAVHLLRKYAAFPSAIPQSEVAPNRAELRRAIAYIHDNLATDLSLKEIAAEVGYSPYHLHRLFRSVMGKPIHRYVIEARLERARALLRSTRLPVAEIATDVGFSDRGHLARNLKRYTGLTPSQLRNPTSASLHPS
jgi:AraC family transcriptional regulator